MPASLLQKALAHSHLSAAWERVAANAGAPGVDGVTVDAFARERAIALRALPRAVLGGSYRAAALRECLIPKTASDNAALTPNNAAQKMRRLAIPTVADRVLQTAVAMVLTPILEREFEDASFAYRRGRSVQQAVARIERLRDEGYVWVVDADIESFFDNIPHPQMLAALAAVMNDERLLALIAQWLAAPMLAVDGTLQPRDRGVPQGSPLSPLLSNLYLDTLDEAVLDANHRLVRFADDFVILCRTRESAEEALALTASVLSSLALRLNSEKTQIVDFNAGFRFLGVNFVRTLAVPRSRGGGDSAARNTFNRARLAPLFADTDFDASSPRSVRLPDAEAAALARASVPKLPDPEFLAESALQAALREADLVAAEFGPGPTEAQAVGEAHGGSKDADRTPNQSTPQPSPLPQAETGPVRASTYVSAAAPPEKSLRALPLLRTLYLLEQGALVSREGDELIISADGETVQEVSLTKLDLVFVFGNIGLTTPALQGCFLHGVAVVYMSRVGKLYGAATPADQTVAALVRAQVLANVFDAARLDFASRFVRGKLVNSRILIRRLRRSRKSDAALSASLHATQLALREASWRTKTAESLDSLRGIEGAAAARYFAALRSIVPEVWQFHARVARPAPDPVNAMLSFGYTLLRNNIVALLSANGFSPQIGLFHGDGAGHSALASDLMEEFRALAVDALVLELLSRRRVSPEDFTLPNASDSDADNPGPSCRMSPGTTRLFIHEFEARMQAPFYSFSTESARDPITLRHAILRQIQRLSLALRSGDGSYTPFIGR